jgi:hypothetical protein
MSRIRATIAAGAIAGSMLVGGVIGATLTGLSAVTSNEDATHEAGESAAREAQENAGQRPTVP